MPKSAFGDCNYCENAPGQQQMSPTGAAPNLSDNDQLTFRLAACVRFMKYCPGKRYERSTNGLVIGSKDRSGFRLRLDPVAWRNRQRDDCGDASLLPSKDDRPRSNRVLLQDASQGIYGWYPPTPIWGCSLGCELVRCVREKSNDGERHEIESRILGIRPTL